jgi:hypothetical protein
VGAYGYNAHTFCPAGDSYGGGIYSTNTSAALTYCTLAGNAALGGAAGVNGTNSGSAGKGYGGNIAQSGGLQWLNTIVAYGLSNNAYGSLTDLGRNISSDASCAFTGAGSLNNTAPLLGPLADNGGPTQTMALAPGSPAIDAAAPLAGINMDQRGSVRPFGLAPDIGAYEATAVVYSSFSMTLPTIANGVPHLKGFGPANRDFRVFVSSNLVSWIEYATNHSDASGFFEFMDYDAASAPARFYRLSSP